MPNVDTPENILSALNAVEQKLIELVGSAWPKLEAKYRDLYRKLTDKEKKWLASVEIKELFAPYDVASKRLDTAIAEQDMLGGVQLGMAEIAVSMGMPQEACMRRIIVKSPTKAKSIKLGNIEFDFGEMGELCASVILTGSKVVDEFGGKRYILVAAGVLLIARLISRKMTTELSELEATVFYGFTQAAGEDKTAVEHAILEKANAARAESGLRLINEADVVSALKKLITLKSVARVESKAATWRIIEKYSVKG